MARACAFSSSRVPLWRNPLLRVFERYVAKAPVHLKPYQDSAQRAFDEFKLLLTPEERVELLQAHKEALKSSAGCDVFDAICARIKKRLFNA
jgi:hypothetical protein